VLGSFERKFGCNVDHAPRGVMGDHRFDDGKDLL
jgi:hypothetical protein